MCMICYVAADTDSQRKSCSWTRAASPARPNYEAAGPNYRGYFGSEPFVLTVLDRVTVKTEVTRTELLSEDRNDTASSPAL
jgi:hypothetical protein